MIIRLISTLADAVDNTDPAVFSSKGYGYTARIIADVPVFVEIDVDAVADEDSAYVNEFSELFVNVSPDETVSVLGSDEGNVWVSEIKVSS